MRMQPRVIYCDNQILVAVKPPNMPSCEDESRDEDMLTWGKAWVKQAYQKPRAVFLGLVHRLDRPAGGLMVFARTSKAAARLSLQVREHSLCRTYRAVLQGELPQREGQLVDYLVKDRRTNMSRAVGKQAPGARQAELTYRVLEQGGGYALAQINLATGRPHQIRVQMAKAGAPLYGDVRYGDEKGRQLALWSTRLVLEHPTRHHKMGFTVLPPETRPWRWFGRYATE
jgi:23S rRNA pseudouridine1911/1915/1917 synthase